MIAIVVAIREELSTFVSRNKFVPAEQIDINQCIFQSELIPDVVLMESGIGKSNAENATKIILDRYKPSLLISAGFAGSVKQSIEPGTIYLCNSLWVIEGTPAFWSTELATQSTSLDQTTALKFQTSINDMSFSCKLGSCMTVDQFVYNRDLKLWIGENFAVDVIDMESFWVSKIATESDIPNIVLRVVLDPVGQKLPPFVVEAAKNKKSRGVLKGLRHMALNPGDIKTIYKLSLQVRRSRKILAENLQAIIEAQQTADIESSTVR